MALAIVVGVCTALFIEARLEALRRRRERQIAAEALLFCDDDEHDDAKEDVGEIEEMPRTTPRASSADARVAAAVHRAAMAEAAFSELAREVAEKEEPRLLACLLCSNSDAALLALSPCGHVLCSTCATASMCEVCGATLTGSVELNLAFASPSDTAAAADE
jgi:hypothetical protein